MSHFIFASNFEWTFSLRYLICGSSGGLQEELEAANSRHQAKVSELQHQLSSLKVRVERGNQALEQKEQVVNSLPPFALLEKLTGIIWETRLTVCLCLRRLRKLWQSWCWRYKGPRMLCINTRLRALWVHALKAYIIYKGTYNTEYIIYIFNFPRRCRERWWSSSDLSSRLKWSLSSCEQNWAKLEGHPRQQDMSWKKRSSCWKRWFTPQNFIYLFLISINSKSSKTCLIVFCSFLQIERLKLSLQEAEEARLKLIDRAKRHVRIFWDPSEITV